MAAYYQRRFGVKLDPDSEVIATLGSKEGFANLALAITAPGDVVLVPNPAYPIHAFGFIIAGAAIRHVPATSPEAYLSGIGRAARHSVPSPLALVVNYPSNPTAQVVDLDFYKEVIAFAKKHEIWVLSDLAYADIYFDDKPPPSILAGRWRQGHRHRIPVPVQDLSPCRAGAWASRPATSGCSGALARIKSYLDYGAFTPIQVAAAAALNGPQDCVEEIRAIYKSRRDVLVDSMGRAGWEFPRRRPRCSPGRRCRNNTATRGSMEFAKQLLIHAKVAVSPGIGFGEYGEGYVRIALVENEHRIRQAARNVKKFLSLRINEPRHAGTAAQMSSSIQDRASQGWARSAAAWSRRCSRTGRALGDRAGRALEIVAVCEPDESKKRGFEFKTWMNDVHAFAKIDADVFVELIGGEDGAGAELVEAALQGGQACGDRQQGADGAPRRPAGRAGRGEEARAQIRGGGGGRHADRQGAAREPDRPWRRSPCAASSTAPATTS